jgi:Zn ribbon nucleic-acid-binding protein
MTKHSYKNQMRGSENLMFNEMTNFIDTNAAYSDFVTNAAILNGEDLSAAFEPTFDSGPRCQFHSRREIGLNIFYQVYITRPRGAEFQISIPWRVQETCPHCQGQGQIYSWNGDNSAYESMNCDECGGEGCHSYDSEISIFVDDALCDQPIIRKRKAGRFNPSLGQRGDLIVNITWVDELPPLGETVN